MLGQYPFQYELRKELRKLYRGSSSAWIKPAQLLQGVLDCEGRMVFVFGSMVTKCSPEEEDGPHLSAEVAAHRPFVQALASFVTEQHPRPIQEERVRAAAALGALSKEQPCSPSGPQWDLVQTVLDACRQEEELQPALEEFAVGLGRDFPSMVLGDGELVHGLVGAIQRGHCGALQLLTHWITQQEQEQQEHEQQEQEEQQQQQAATDIFQQPGVVEALCRALNRNRYLIDRVPTQGCLIKLLSASIAHSASRAALLANPGFVKSALPDFLADVVETIEGCSLISALLHHPDTRAKLLTYKQVLWAMTGCSIWSESVKQVDKEAECLSMLSALVSCGASRDEVLQGVQGLLPGLAKGIDGGLRLAPKWKPVVEAVAVDGLGREMLLANAKIRAAVLAGVIEGSKSFLAVFELLLVDRQAAAELLLGLEGPVVLQLLPVFLEHAAQGKQAYLYALGAVAQYRTLWQYVPDDSKQQLVEVVYSGYKQHFSEQQHRELVLDLASRRAVLQYPYIVDDVAACMMEGKAEWMKAVTWLLRYERPADLDAAGLMDALRVGLSVGREEISGHMLGPVEALLTTNLGREYLRVHSSLLEVICRRVGQGGVCVGGFLKGLVQGQGGSVRRFLLKQQSLLAAVLAGAVKSGMAEDWWEVVQYLIRKGGGPAMCRAVFGNEALLEACLLKLVPASGSGEGRGRIREMLQSFDKEAASAKLQELLCGSSGTSPELLEGAGVAYQALKGESAMAVLLGAVARQCRNLQEVTVAFARGMVQQHREQGVGTGADAAAVEDKDEGGPAAKRPRLQ